MKTLHRFLLAAGLLVLAFTSRAQISGTLTSQQQPLESISVSLLRAKDSGLVKIALTDKTGQFQFTNLAAGSYRLSVNSLGYQPYLSRVYPFSGMALSLGSIELPLQAKSLGEVTVSSKKPLVELRADKMAVNVDASPTNAGNTALEVLEKSPGVSVDKDGNISLKGKQGVTVLVDGRPSYLSGADLANLLKGMSASQLDQIEIMTNPPARFDASGNSGVINIKTKKNKTVGFNGSLNLGYGQGVYPKTNGGLNLNYRKNRINLFGSYNYSYRGSYQHFNVTRNVFNQNQALAFTLDQNGYMPDTRSAHSAKAGIDITFSKKTNASLTLNSFNIAMQFDNDIRNRILDDKGDLQTLNTGRTYMTPNVSKYNGNFNIQHKLDSTGKELSFDLDYVSYNDKHKQQFQNRFYNAGGTLTAKPDTLQGNVPSAFEVIAGKLDLVLPFTAKTKLETGIKLSAVSSDNNVRFDSIIIGNPVLDVNRSNYFIYKENIYAAYASLNTPISKKLSVQAGLRYEYTTGNGHQVTTHTSFTKEYGKLFPTLYFTYELNEKHQLNLNYGRRVTRPAYRDMNPFTYILDRYTNQKGNPNLQPQFSQNIELSHAYNKFLITTFNYARTNDVISDVIETDEISKTAFLVKKNIATQEQWGFAVNFSKPVNSWLTINTNVLLANNRFKGFVNNAAVDFSSTTANFSGSLQSKLGKGWDAEINGFYRTREIEGVSFSKGMGMFSLAVSKSVLNNKGKITLNARDLFALQQYTGITKFSTVDAVMNNRWDNRMISLSFNYRFGKTFKTNKRSSGSAAEEQSRIGG